MKKLLAFLCLAVLVLSGCAVGVSRKGYSVPTGPIQTNSVKPTVIIKRNWQYDTNQVVQLGTIRDYDTGFSVNCDEVAVLDIFCHDAILVGADVINITDESQPSPWTSSCYRATADFLRCKDREKAVGLVSDPQYAPNQIVDRAAANGKRTRNVLIGAVAGGVLGFVVVAAVTTPADNTNGVYAVPPPTRR